MRANPGDKNSPETLQDAGVGRSQDKVDNPDTEANRQKGP